jgi:hypothetical protein
MPSPYRREELIAEMATLCSIYLLSGGDGEGEQCPLYSHSHYKCRHYLPFLLPPMGEGKQCPVYTYSFYKCRHYLPFPLAPNDGGGDG